MPRQFSSRVTIAPDVMFRIIGDEAVILNLKSQLYLGLNPVGTRVWTVLQGSPSIEAAHACLLEEFDVEPERLRQDMDKLLDQMLEQGLVELRPGEAVAG
jgi:hypothetical protein